MEKTKIDIDQRIINTLLLNSSFIDNLGLLNGKMGISIFFYHLAHETGNSLYENYAGELIDEIYEEITVETPLDFANGLAGIGWGIEYLARNNFIEADTDEVLEEFDKRLAKELIYNSQKEIGLFTGLAGLGAYFLKRIQNRASNDEKMPTLTNKEILIHLINELEQKLSDSQIDDLLTGNQRSSEIRTPGTKISKGTKATLETFDITWDYPALIWFLAALLEEGIFNLKVEKLIERLLIPLKVEANLPKLYCNRLLLILVLTKLLQIPRTQETTGIVKTIKTIIPELQKGINPGSIKAELFHKNFTVRQGIPGIVWIYMQLYNLTTDSYYKEQSGYWLNQYPSIEAYDKANAIYKESDKSDTAFGLLDGLAGLIFTKYLPS